MGIEHSIFHRRDGVYVGDAVTKRDIWIVFLASCTLGALMFWRFLVLASKVRQKFWKEYGNTMTNINLLPKKKCDRCGHIYRGIHCPRFHLGGHGAKK